MKRVLFIIFLISISLFGANKLKGDIELDKILKYFDYSESSFQKKGIKYTLVETGEENSVEGYKLSNENLILVFEEEKLQFIEILENTNIFDIKIGTSYKEAQNKIGNISPKKIYLVGDDKPSYLFVQQYKGRKITFLSYSKETIDEITIYKK